MFNSIKHIPVDRKNSLPVSDLQTRYRATSTPVVFGDLTKYWPATRKWNHDYISEAAGVSISDKEVSRIALQTMPELESDFTLPRLGFHFYPRLSGLYIARAGATTIMRQSSDVMHTVRCHFGEPASVLLIPPLFTPLMYRVGFSRNSIRDIDFQHPQFDKYPALTKVSGYVAELDHGDAVYIPAGFWHCTSYQGDGVALSLKSLSGSFANYAATLGKLMLSRGIRATHSKPKPGSGLSRLERRTAAATNARFAKYQRK